MVEGARLESVRALTGTVGSNYFMKFIRKYFSPAILILSVLLLFYIFYKSEIYWKNEAINYYTTYYIIAFLLIIFSIITFFLNEKIKTYIIIILFSTVFSLYVFETYLTYFVVAGSIKKVKLYNEQTGKTYDTRTVLEIYNDLKKNDKTITVAVSPQFYLSSNLHTLSGVSNSNTINCNENGYYSIYKSDRYGFNNPDEEWDNKNIEYLLVGDSFVHGDCVNRPNDIASVLRSLSNKSALNLGYGSNGPLTEYATIREYIRPEVKKILWLYFEGNDIINLEQELKYEILLKYLSEKNFSQNLKSRQDEIDKLSNTGIEWAKNEDKKNNSFKFKFFKFVKIFNVRLLLLNQKPELQVEFKEILKQVNNLAIENNSKLYFIYLPEYFRYKFYYDNSNYLKIKKIVKELNIEFIDINLNLLDKEERPLKFFPFEMSGHYNVEGYKKVTEKIFELTSNE